MYSRTRALVRLCAWFAVTGFVVGTGVGCHSPANSGGQTFWRLIGDDPEATFVRQGILRTEEVSGWELDLWTVQLQEHEYKKTSSHIELHPDKRYITLGRQRPQDVESIDALEVHLRGMARQPAILEWWHPGEAKTGKHRLRVDLGEDMGSNLKAYRFVVGGHPGWHEGIQEVRIAVVLPNKLRGVFVEKVTALKEKADFDKINRTLQRDYKAFIEDDLRNARVALPGAPIEASVALPASVTELSFAIGFLGENNGTITHQIYLESRSDRTLIFEETLSPEKQGWQQRRISLADYAGREIRLSFETTKPEGYEPERLLPVWGHPEIVAPEIEVHPNVVLISIDTLRADHLSLYGYERETSPKIDAWARRHATVFESAVASAPWTLPSHTTIMTGLDALHHGVNFPQDGLGSHRTLAEYLRDQGYSTMAITGGGFMHPQYGFARGFQRFRAAGVRMGFANELEEGIRLARRWFGEQAGQPVFLFFHTYEVHNPFRPRQPFFKNLTGIDEERTVDVEILTPDKAQGFADRRRLIFSENGKKVDLPGSPEAWGRDLYDSGIAYTDDLIGDFLRDLERLDPTRPTLVVLTSDHGELFGEHGMVNHVSLYDENLLVPLIIADPKGRGAGKRVAHQVRSSDILPTILELLDMEPPAVDGISLLPLMNEVSDLRDRDARLAWSYAPSSNFGIAIRDDSRHKFVFRHGAWGTDEPTESFYDLRQDPGEERSIAKSSELTRWRELTEKTLAAKLPGLRFKISNQQGKHPIAVDLLGPQIQRTRVKSVRVEQSRADFIRPTEMKLRVLPGEEALFSFEGQKAAPLTLRVGPMGKVGTTELTIEPAEITKVWSVQLESGQWQAREVERAEGDGIFFWWNRRVEAGQETEPVIDEELKKQLEALGYLN